MVSFERFIPGDEKEVIIKEHNSASKVYFPFTLFCPGRFGTVMPDGNWWVWVRCGVGGVVIHLLTWILMPTTFN
jgi:hypothetical protein